MTAIDTDIRAAKTRIRKQCALDRKSLDADYKRRADAAICEKLESMPEIAGAKYAAVVCDRRSGAGPEDMLGEDGRAGSQALFPALD